MITILILLVALGILGWGFVRARPFGQVGLLAWLQSVVLMAPWLVFFGLFAAGLYLNLAAVLLMIVLSTVLYVVLGKRLRSLGRDPAMQQRLSPQASAQDAANMAEGSTDGSLDGSGERVADGTASKDENASKSTPEKAEFEALPPEDLKAIQGLFGIDTFFATETVPYLDGAIFKGNLRGEPDATHARLSNGLQERLGDRYRLFLISGPDQRPTVVVLPSSSDPPKTTTTQWSLAIALGAATILTCFEAAGLLLGFDLFSDFGRVGEALPIASGILFILIAHEVGHRWMARRYQIRLSPPFFLPTWQLGSLGSLMRFESLLPNRNVLFDISLAGPLASGIVSLLMLMLGLVLSLNGSDFTVPPSIFKGSILVGTLASAVLGSALQEPVVAVHPLVAVGWIGLVVTALNTMPAGQLDGGRIMQAIYGRTVAGRATFATVIVLGIASLVNPLALYWAIVILFVQRNAERPALNELSEPDDTRAALGLLILFLMVATLLPLTPSLAGRLGIGG
ncbi:MAG: site-2 protease family protein [Kaiparowitsia implicata GSE-PSE-MK54-09C]|jgi:membrane-associated protease RseP (regulator of RpoE activity)|nr:site-2 protease family protein [Kaiparowitsia implicata GSE-PSE-MK54-09C]